MARERIEVVVDGRQTAFGAGRPTLSSVDTPWPGFLLERTSGIAPRRARKLCHPQTLVVLIAAGEASISYCSGPEHHRFRAEQDSICIFPSGGREEAFFWSGECEILAVRISEADVGPMHPCDGECPLAAIAPHRVGVHDPPLARLIRGMAQEIEAGCPNGPLYGEAMCTAAAAYLCSRYRRSADTKPQEPLEPVHRVLRHVRNNLAGDLSLPALAAITELSPHHLCRLFKQTVGMTPHRYVLRERIRRAQKLLCAGDGRTVLDVALALGFANQSHFTEAFRRVTGTTPRRYRQDA